MIEKEVVLVIGKSVANKKVEKEELDLDVRRGKNQKRRSQKLGGYSIDNITGNLIYCQIKKKNAINDSKSHHQRWEPSNNVQVNSKE